MGKKGFLVDIYTVTSLAFALNHFPDRTPNRWKLISRYVSERQPTTGKQRVPKFPLGDGGTEFLYTPDHCKTLTLLIQDECPQMLSVNENFMDPLFNDGDKNPFKPIVLSPNTTQCLKCKVNLIMKNMAFPLVYTSAGCLVGVMFSGKCSCCLSTYYPSYVIHADNQCIFNDPQDSEYFHISRSTVFHTSVLVGVTNNILFSHASFQSRAAVYNANFRTETNKRMAVMQQAFKRTRSDSSEDVCKLTEQRLEEAWFIWELVNFHKENRTLQGTNLMTEHDFDGPGRRRDIESLCAESMEMFFKGENKWIHHECEVLGCKEGFIMVDGIEKIRRPMCAAPKSSIRLSRSMPKVISCCPNTPVIGGKSQQASKYCRQHQYLQPCGQESSVADKENSNGKRPMESEHNEAPAAKVPPIIIRLPEVEGLDPKIVSTELPENDDDTLLIGCRKKTNVQKFYNKTAGLLAAVKPCGVIVQHTEMFTCESPTQVFVMLLRTFGNKSDISRLRYVGYDRACDLHPFLVNLAKKDNPGAQLLLDSTEYLVDTFHCLKHTEPCCMPLNNPECRYHPKLPKFKEIHTASIM